jgi:branched-chain amino acid transport system substrate-binding protein
MIAQALEAAKGNVENKEAFLAALRKVEVDAPRGKVKLDAYQNPIHPVYIRKVEKKGGALQNTVIATYPGTSQFWKWGPEGYLAMPAYADMKGKWATK